jgi:hypothetical protein
MSEAETVSTTNRRGFLMASAAVPFATPAVALPIGDAAVLAMEPILKQRWQYLEDVACAAIERAETAFWAWRGRNPAPKYDGSRSPIPLEVINQIRRLADERESERELSGYSQRLEAWREREAIAKQNAGLPEAQKLEMEANEKVSAAIALLCSMSATTLAGQRVKARLAEMTSSKDLAWSLVRDILGQAQFGPEDAD